VVKAALRAGIGVRGIVEAKVGICDGVGEVGMDADDVIAETRRAIFEGEE